MKQKLGIKGETASESTTVIHNPHNYPQFTSKQESPKTFTSLYKNKLSTYQQD